MRMYSKYYFDYNQVIIVSSLNYYLIINYMSLKEE